MKSATLHPVKFARAAALAKTGRYPATFAALWRAVPQSLRDELPARHLATIIDTMCAQHTRGESRGWWEAVETYDIATDWGETDA